MKPKSECLFRAECNISVAPSGSCDSQLAACCGQFGGHHLVVQSDPPAVPELGLGPAIPPYSVVLDGGISTRDNGRGKAEITSSSPGLDLNLQSRVSSKMDLIMWFQSKRASPSLQAQARVPGVHWPPAGEWGREGGEMRARGRDAQPAATPRGWRRKRRDRVPRVCVRA